MFSYESLDIWRLAIDYAKVIYEITKSFPKDELYGLVSQLRRAAVSISANIAEGSGAISYKDKANYLNIAIKSTLEVTSEIVLAYELGYISNEQRILLIKQAETLIKMIRAFRNSLSS